ncbi:class I SAM-dependent methyltransferase [Gramella sp. AN32]|uniref:O-methyltransferase n=1 Tax=Christiangramia antarctica TaxID=2058158 RepID=A0ABW5XD70_9FLAO|nr:class I SAM-dependent methyltransferase [Gramella sp. AN32]MCM4156460.1 SAM-dependent methyltransferase [Gramella sp. AN32]
MKLEDINKPSIFAELERKGKEIGFNMPSDLYIGSLLKNLITSKPNSNFLELGTGIGLSLSWMLSGMDSGSRMVSVDNDPKLIEIANSFFGNDQRLELICANGEEWIVQNDLKFDLIFADAWPGKYSLLDETLAMLNPGGFYMIDDMKEQPNWPDGHAEKANSLIEILDSRTDLVFTKLNWSTGVIIGTKLL